MSKEKLLNDIEEGLLSYYLEKDHSVQSDILFEPEQIYEGQGTKYHRIAKQIIFKAKTNLNKKRVTKIISIANESGRLESIKGKNEENIYSIFKKHIEHHGLAANYHNLDRITEEEMANILQQINLTSLFDEIDAGLDDE